MARNETAALRLTLGLALLLAVLAAAGVASAAYQVERSVVNSAGNTRSGYGKLIWDSVGEANAGQSFGRIYSAQAGYFNEYYLPAPTPTITCTPIRTFGGEVLSAEYMFAAPNPIRGTQADIYFDLAMPAEVTVKIYTTSNQLVISHHWDALPAGTNHWRWNASGIANGVYLLWIKATDGSGKSTSLIKKIALVK